MGYEIGRLTRIPLGYVGENATRTIEIDVSEWQAKWPDAMIAMTVQRPTEDDLYIPATEVEDGILKWEVVQSDVAIAGKGLAQVRAVDSGTGKVYISRVVGTIIEPSMRGTTDTTAPDKSEAWVDQVLGAVGRVEDLSEDINALINMTVNVNILPAGSDGYAEYADGVLTIYIPKGDKGETGSASAVTVNGVEGVDDNITLTGDDIPLAASDQTALSAAVVKRDRVANLLDNSDFTKPVNQRGGASYTGAAYGIDRWKGGTGTSSVTVTDQGVKFASNGSWNMIYQYFDAGLFGGKTLTFAACTSEGNLIVGSGVYPAARGETLIVADVDEETGLQLGFDTRHTYDGVRIAIADTAARDVTVRWAALYEGAYTADTLPTYQPKGYAAELMECKRYFLKVQGVSRLCGYCTTTQANMCLQLDVPMRVTPTLTVTSLDTIRAAGKNLTPTGASVQSMTDDSVRINVTYAADSAVVNQVGTWAVPVFTLSADIMP